MLLLFSSTIAIANVAMAEGFNWFGGRDIDYWNEGRMVTGSESSLVEDDSPDVTLPVTDSVVRSTDFLPFDWKAYENPLSPQFWDDGGNYVPPRPLRMVAANPTRENVDRYLAWQKRKFDVTDNLSRVLAARHNSSSQGNKQNPAPDGGKERRSEPSVSRSNDFNWNNVTLSFIYRSSCPHCQRELSTISKLKTLGAKIMSFQLMSQSEKPLLENSQPLSNADASRLNISVTPTLIIKAGGKQSRIEGYADFETIEDEARRLL